MKKALSLAMALLMLISMVCVVPVMAATPDGSAQNPYQVARPDTAPGSVTIPAHGAVYYQYKNSVFNGWTIEAYGLTAISVDGVIYDEMDHWNNIAVTLKFNMVSPGIVGYINDTDEEVEVSLTHTEPVGSQSNPAALESGENTLSIAKKDALFYTVYVAKAAGEHTFTIANAASFEVIVYTNGDPKEGDANALVNGTLTLELEKYDTLYITLKSTVSNAKAVLTIDAPAVGTEENPLYLTDEEMKNTHAWSAGDMYFWVPEEYTGNILTITSVAGAEFTALVDGLDYVSEGGVMNVELDAGDWYIEVILTSEVDNEVSFAIEFAEGSVENPIELKDGDNEIAIPKGGYYYYTYTTQTEGLLVLTPADAAVFDLLDILYEDAKGAYHYASLAKGASSAIMTVSAGQTLTISAHGIFNEEANVYEAVNTTLNVAVKDLLMYNTFEGAEEEGDLEGWTSKSDLVLEEAGETSNVANGFYSLEFTTTQSYANMYKYVNVEKNTNYEVTFKAMASEASTLWVKLNDNWVADVAQADVKVGTEWAEYTMSVNSGDFTNLVLLFQHSGENVVTYWFDDIIITKGGASEPDTPDTPDQPGEVGVVINGNFENGDEGWKLNSSASVEDGSLKLDNSGQWAEAAMQDVPVEAGVEYTLVWKSKRIDGTGAFMMFLLDENNGTVATQGQNWMNSQSADWVEHSLKFTAPSNTLRIKLSSEVNNPGVILIDDIKLLTAAEPVEPTAGQIANGDFETGDNTGWEKWQSTAIEAGAAHNGAYGAHIKGNGSWGGMLNQTFAVEDGKTYELTFWYKVNQNGFNMQFTGIQSGASYASVWAQKNEWTQFTQTFTVSGDTQLKINFCGGGNGIAEDAYIDDVMIRELKEPSFDGYIYNGDFETGTAAPWNTYGNESGVMAEAAHSGSFGLKMVNSGNWDGTGDQTFAVVPGKKYAVTLWIKTIANGVNIQVQDGGAIVTSAWVDNAAEWTQMTFEFVAASETAKLNFCGGGNGLATIVYTDDIEVVEVKDPSFDGYIYNGDFECGSLAGWNVFQQTIVSTDAAYSGNFGVNLKGTGGWGAHLEQIITGLVAGETYNFSLWFKGNAQGSNMTLKQGGQDLICVDGETKVAHYLSATEWTQLSFTFVAIADGDATLNFCGSGTGEAEDVYVDDILLVHVENPVEPPVEIIYGDANGDGNINNRDLALLQQYINKWDVTLDLAAADANGDGSVNNRDLALLQQYINKWEVTLGPKK